MKKWFNSLSPTMQVITVIIIAVVLFFLFRVVKSYSGRLASFSESVGEQAALSSQGVHRSYTQIQYNSMANQLYYAMKGVGTDEETIYSVIQKIKNDQDFIALENAFGIRDTYNLQAWIRGDLSTSEVQKVNSILSNNGISKSF